MDYLEAINETAYLSVPNAPVYRKIMRCFYREYEKMNFQLYKEDYSGKSEQLMKSVEFVVHKDKFVKYLNEFVQELQRHSRRIERILKTHMALIEGTLLEKVVQSELDIPHAVLEMRGNAEPSIRENVQGKWRSLASSKRSAPSPATRLRI